MSSSGPSPSNSAPAHAWRSTLSWVRTTPFGRPVVPEV